MAMQKDAARDDPARSIDNLHDGARRDGLAGSALSDDAERLAFVELEGDVFHGPQVTGRSFKAGIQALDLQKLAGHGKHLVTYRGLQHRADRPRQSSSQAPR